MSAAQLARQLLRAMVAGDRDALEALLDADAGVRIWRPDGQLAARERTRAAGLLLEERSQWPWARLEIVSAGGDDRRCAVEFVVQARLNGQVVDLNRAAFIEVRGGRVTVADIYAAGPVPSLRRGWIAPANLSPEERDELWRSFDYHHDVRRIFPSNSSSYRSFDHSSWGTGDAHPGSNNVASVHWSSEEADRRIDEMIAWHRDRGIGFQWRVGDWDEPPDLGERLERHGLVLAGDQALMARVGLDNLEDIRVNPAITVELLDGSQPDAVEAALQITAVAFQWTKEQVDLERPNLFEQVQSSTDELVYLARLDGRPVAEAMLVLRGPTAYLAGAATLPEVRGQRLYSTLLKRRLADAKKAGFEIAMIHAEPMSRRVVARYGFEPVCWYRLYGWMPEIDPAVIASLVQSD